MLPIPGPTCQNTSCYNRKRPLAEPHLAPAREKGTCCRLAGATIAAAPVLVANLLAPDYHQSLAALLVGFALSEMWRAPAAIMIRDVSPPNLGSTGSAVHLCVRNLIGGLGPLGAFFWFFWFFRVCALLSNPSLYPTVYPPLSCGLLGSVTRPSRAVSITCTRRQLLATAPVVCASLPPSACMFACSVPNVEQRLSQDTGHSCCSCGWPGGEDWVTARDAHRAAHVCALRHWLLLCREGGGLGEVSVHLSSAVQQQMTKQDSHPCLMRRKALLQCCRLAVNSCVKGSWVQMLLPGT